MITCEIMLVESTTNTTVQDAAQIKVHAKGTVYVKSTYLLKLREGAILQMEKLLTMWTDHGSEDSFKLNDTWLKASWKI